MIFRIFAGDTAGMTSNKLLLLFFVTILLWSCNSSDKTDRNSGVQTRTSKSEVQNDRAISSQFKEYWYAGQAEITSYRLQQERYGEIREGTAVNIFVTEDFLPNAQVKTDSNNKNSLSVLKLNQTKNFNTGIYPYSLMTSVFSPIAKKGHALKVSHSAQEWCGQVYMQLNNRSSFEIESHSYFENEADQKINLSKTWLENELWNLIRINPEELPTGDIKVIPSFEYVRFSHKEIGEQAAFASLKQGDSITIYTLNYPGLQRQLSLFFKSTFPYSIEKWEEVSAAHQNDTTRLHTTALKLKTIKTDYWNQNRNEFSHLRDSLMLNQTTP